MNCIAQLRHVDMKILRSTSPRPATVSLLYVDHSFGCCIYLIPKQKIHGSLLTGRFSQGQGRFGQNWRSSVPIHHAKLTRVFLAVSSPATRSLAFYKRPRPLTRERERERERTRRPEKGKSKKEEGTMLPGVELARRRRVHYHGDVAAGEHHHHQPRGGAGGLTGPALAARTRLEEKLRGAGPPSTSRSVPLLHPPSSSPDFLLLLLLFADRRDDKNEIILSFFLFVKRTLDCMCTTLASSISEFISMYLAALIRSCAYRRNTERDIPDSSLGS
jgi:hypothetical protein